MLNLKKLCSKALKTWGYPAQLLMVYEEVGELMSALNKFERRRITYLKVLEEIIDVEIMLAQLKLMFHCYTNQKYYDEYLKLKKHKLQRLKTRLKNAQHMQTKLNSD